jgi:hypothetical protein
MESAYTRETNKVSFQSKLSCYWSEYAKMLFFEFWIWHNRNEFFFFFAMVVSEKLRNSTKYEEQFYDKIPDWIIDSWNTSPFFVNTA